MKDIVREDRIRATKSLRSLRPTIADAIERQSLIPTLAMHLFVETFLDRLLLALAEDRNEDLSSWVKRLPKVTPTTSQLPEALSACLLELERSVHAHDELSVFRANIDKLRSDLELLLQGTVHDRPMLEGVGDELDALIDGLITKLEQQDPATAEHSRAVSLWCSRIARRMALSREDTVLVARGGLIHDVGKMLTPKEILQAPRSLDDVEWEIMQRHALDGAEIVSKEPSLQFLVPVVRNHHERFDGRGYPDGLEGANISLGARIVTVADAFNAMIAPRPYRRPFAPFVALEELKRHRGSQFDPRVVEAMIEVVLGSPST